MPPRAHSNLGVQWDSSSDPGLPGRGSPTFTELPPMVASGESEGIMMRIPCLCAHGNCVEEETEAPREKVGSPAHS